MNSHTTDRDWPAKWVCVRERLRRELGDPIFDAWIGPLILESSDKDNLTIGAAKPFVRNWVANHYVARIERAFRAEGAEPNALTIVVSKSPAAVGASVSKEFVPVEPQPVPACSVSTGSRGDLWSRILRPQQTFESFVAGPENEFGHGAARAFATGHGGDVSLLYIHGGYGYGKTHLLNAAALQFGQRGRRVLFLRAEDFMRHFLGAIHRKDTLSFKEEVRTAEVLLIDDLHHICRSAATASEFLYTINALSDLRRRVVVAADRAPAALEGLGPDVKARLSGGLVIQLGQPCRETRLAILQSRAEDYVRSRPDVQIAEGVLERIADVEGVSPREFIGILAKLVMYADLTKKPITAERVEEAMGLRVAGGVHSPNIEDIQRKTAEFYTVEIKDFYSPMRARRVARPRQVAMYLARKLTIRSLPEIGRRFGGRDHTTVLHACRRVEALCHEDPLFKQEVDFLHQMLSPREF